MKKFAYLFAINGKITWSSETDETLIHRMDNEPEMTEARVRRFIADSKPGSILYLDTGEAIVNTGK